MSSTRLYKYDTLKGILIILVLLGHILEQSGGNMFSKIAVFGIYSLHMPLFMTIAGKFAKFKPMDAIMYILLAFLFQTWFMLALGIYYLLIPLFARIQNQKAQFLAIAITLVIGLLFSYIPIQGPHSTLTRCVTFLPYFLLGYYNIFESKRVTHKKVVGLLLGAVTVFALPALLQNHLEPLFLCSTYRADGLHTIFHRFGIYTLGSLWTWWCLSVAPNKECRVITTLGKHTLYIYLLHTPMIPIAVALTCMLYQTFHLPPFITQISISIIWCALLYPIAYLLQKGTSWLQSKFRPINQWCQKRLLPAQK